MSEYIMVYMAQKGFSQEFVFGAFVLLIMTSCQPNLYQINELKKSKNQDRLVYRNQDVRVEFNTWGEGGEYYFLVKNMRKDSFIWVDQSNSNIVINGKSNSYFENVTVRRKHVKRNYGKYFERETSYEVSRKEKKYVPIPPNSFKVFILGKIGENPIHKFKGSKPKVLKGKEKYYQEQNSPLKIRNFLYYYKDQEYKRQGVLKGSFYLSKIEIMNEEKFNKTKKYRNRTDNKFYFERDINNSEAGWYILGGVGALALILGYSSDT